MRRSILEGKQGLAVDDDPEILEVLEKEIFKACPTCRFDKAATYIEAVERMVSLTYDFVVLDITGARGFDLLNLAVMRKFPVAMLASNPPNAEALKYPIQMGAGTYLPREKLGEIVPFLEDMLACRYQTGWKRLFEKIKGGFASTFGSNSELGISLPGSRIGR